MRTLIIGAGVAGLTLAALMQQRGATPAIVEREQSLAGHGYMLGLYPLGGRVLNGLGLHPQYLARSVTMRAYRIGNGRGELLREYSLDAINRRYGAIQGIGRDELVDLLFEKVDGSCIHTATTVTRLQQGDGAVEATFSDGSTDEFDLLVGADGLHSQTRALVLEEDEYAYRDTGWGGWVFWADPAAAPPDTYTEYWGAGRFLGFYPTQERLGVFAGGDAEQVRALGLAGLAQELREAFGQSVPALEAAPQDTAGTFFWQFHDCRAQHWRKGRVILLGDAAVGFLPTAGVGASMAMESAAALNDELSRSNAEQVTQALALYEKRHRRRVEKAQTTSRRLGNWMAVKSRPAAWARNQLLRLYTVEQLGRGITSIMDEPI